MRLAHIGKMAILAILLAGLTGPLTVTAAEPAELSLHMVGEAPLWNEDGQPVLVAGIWYELSVTLDSPLEQVLEVDATSLDASASGMEGVYRWVRDEVNDTWSDPLYGTFLDDDWSEVAGNAVTFRLGMDSSATPGPWQLVVRADGASPLVKLVDVQSPEVAFGLASADFRFRAEPFVPIATTSDAESQYLRIRNEGNVPLGLGVSFSGLQDELSLVNPLSVAHPNEDQRYRLALEMDPRPPQILKIGGVARAEIRHLIPSPGAGRIIPAVESAFDVTIIVGRTGYTVEVFEDIVFQTLESFRGIYDSTVAWKVFLTGTQSVLVDVSVVNGTLAGVFRQESGLDLPAVVSPRLDNELPLTVQVHLPVPSTVVEVVFTLQLVETGEIRTYRTLILVGPKPVSPTLPPSYLWLFASLVSASVLALVSYNQWRLETDRWSPRASRFSLFRKARRGEGKASLRDSKRGKEAAGREKGGKDR